MKLSVRTFAITSGIVWGLGLFCITWWIIFIEGATGEITLIGRIYVGYSISPLGSLVGLAWGLVDGLIIGGLFAWLYNSIFKILPHKYY
jgi:hypothetical protein